jgi:hypothetical protein
MPPIRSSVVAPVTFKTSPKTKLALVDNNGDNANIICPIERGVVDRMSSMGKYTGLLDRVQPQALAS